MRIREFLAELTRPANTEDAGQRLQQAGYKVLSNAGLFSTVWARPNEPYVLKLFTARDTAYLQFLKLVQAMPNEHFPVIRGRPMRVSDTYYGVRIERLKPITASHIPVVQQCTFYLGALARMGDARKSTGVERWRGIGESQKALRWLRFNHPSLAKALDAVYEYVIKADPEFFQPDAHLANVGLRGNTIVFMDPVASGSTTDDPELRMESGPTQQDLENIEHDKAVKRKPDIRRKRFVDPGVLSVYSR